MKTIRETEDKDRAEYLMATAKLFDACNRPVPSHILRDLWHLRPWWRSRQDIPAQVVEACSKLDRLQTGKEPRS